MDEILFAVEEKMESGIEYLRTEFRGIRTGRATPGLVEHIKIDYFGSATDLRQLANIATPEANQIIIKPFDPSSLKDIEKAIMASGLGINPSNDGKMLRLTVPALSGERRTQLVGQIKKMAEQARVTIRNARRDGNKDVDAAEKASELTEDEAKRGKDDIQELTKKFEAQVTQLVDAKTKEIQGV